MITTMFFVVVPFFKRAPRIIIHLAMNVEKGGGVLMRITLPNLKHSFICPIPVPDPDSGFRIPDFRVFHTPIHSTFISLPILPCNVPVKSNLKHPPGIPQAFDLFFSPRGLEGEKLMNLVFSGTGHLITTQGGGEFDR